jgi:hypothetical protein
MADSRPEDQNVENWSIIQVNPPVTVRGEDDRLQPAVTFEAAEPRKTVIGTLDQIWVSPGSEVTMEVRENHNTVMTILVEHQASSSVISLHGPFWVIMDYCQIADNSNLSYQADTLTFKAQLPAHNHQIKTTSDNQTMVFILTLNNENITDLFSKSGLTVTALDVTYQNKKGAPQTALVTEGELTYLGFPEIKKVPITKSDFISLERVDMLIKEMDLVFDPKEKGIRMLIEGVAGSVRTGSKSFSKDQRLTLFDIFWHNPKMTILFSIICWVFPTTIGGYRLINEFKK